MKIGAMILGLAAGVAVATATISVMYPDVSRRMLRDGKRAMKDGKRIACKMGMM
ncbi:MAG: hypothetical protein RRY79_02445 [Clostridia bacterium]